MKLDITKLLQAYVDIIDINGETDYDKVYTMILKDLREGYLGRVTFDEI